MNHRMTDLQLYIADSSVFPVDIETAFNGLWRELSHSRPIDQLVRTATLIQMGIMKIIQCGEGESIPLGRNPIKINEENAYSMALRMANRLITHLTNDARFNDLQWHHPLSVLLNEAYTEKARLLFMLGRYADVIAAEQQTDQQYMQVAEAFQAALVKGKTFSNNTPEGMAWNTALAGYLTGLFLKGASLRHLGFSYSAEEALKFAHLVFKQHINNTPDDKIKIHSIRELVKINQERSINYLESSNDPEAIASLTNTQIYIELSTYWPSSDIELTLALVDTYIATACAMLDSASYDDVIRKLDDARVQLSEISSIANGPAIDLIKWRGFAIDTWKAIAAYKHWLKMKGLVRTLRSPIGIETIIGKFAKLRSKRQELMLPISIPARLEVIECIMTGSYFHALALSSAGRNASAKRHICRLIRLVTPLIELNPNRYEPVLANGHQVLGAILRHLAKISDALIANRTALNSFGQLGHPEITGGCKYLSFDYAKRVQLAYDIAIQYAHAGRTDQAVFYNDLALKYIKESESLSLSKSSRHRIMYCETNVRTERARLSYREGHDDTMSQELNYAFEVANNAPHEWTVEFDLLPRNIQELQMTFSALAPSTETKHDRYKVQKQAASVIDELELQTIREIRNRRETGN